MNISSLLIGAALVLALIAGAFLTGRWTAPNNPYDGTIPPPAVLQVAATRYVDRTVVKTRRVVVTEPGGATTVTDETERETESPSATQPPVLPQPRPTSAGVYPDWRLAATVGLTMPLSTAISPVYGLEVDRRLLGPVWAGIRANTSPYVGVALGVTF